MPDAGSRTRRPSAGVLLALLPFYLFLFGPIGVILLNSFNRDHSLLSWGGFTTHWYHVVLADADVRNALKTSLLLALASTALSLFVGITGAMWLHHAKGTARNAFLALTYSRLLLPEIVLAIALYLFLSATAFPFGFVAMMLGHTVINSAYVSVVIQSRLRGRDAARDEAARDLGATAWRTFRRVTFPEIFPAVLAAALLAFTFSFDNIITSFFLSGDVVVTIPILVFSKIRFVLTPEVNAIAALMMVITTTTLGLFLVVGRRFRFLVA